MSKKLFTRIIASLALLSMPLAACSSSSGNNNNNNPGGYTPTPVNPTPNPTQETSEGDFYQAARMAMENNPGYQSVTVTLNDGLNTASIRFSKKAASRDAWSVYDDISGKEDARSFLLTDLNTISTYVSDYDNDGTHSHYYMDATGFKFTLNSSFGYEGTTMNIDVSVVFDSYFYPLTGSVKITSGMQTVSDNSASAVYSTTALPDVGPGPGPEPGGSQVSEAQWNNALKHKQSDNFVFQTTRSDREVVNEAYGEYDGGKIRYVFGNNEMYYNIDWSSYDDNTGLAYVTSYSYYQGTWETYTFQANINDLGQVTMLFPFSYKDFTYDSASGLYTASSATARDMTFTNVKIGFMGGNVVYTTFSYSGNTFLTAYTHGLTHVELPDVGPGPVDQIIDVDDALKICDGLSYGETTKEEYQIGGYVSKIVTPYNSNYGNISFNITDESGSSVLYIYRLNITESEANKLGIGSKVVVKGYLQNYNGTYELAAGGTLISVTGGEIPDPPQVYKVTVKQALSVALDVGETSYDKYEVSGYITKIDTPYEEKYGNISFTIRDLEDAEYTMLVYRLPVDADTASLLVAGVKVTIQGNIMNYQGNNQIASGATLLGIEGGVEPQPQLIDVEEAISLTSQLASGESTSYVYHVEGYISNIVTPYNSTYSNISFNIVDLGGTSQFLVYRLTVTEEEASHLGVGTRVIVEGYLYNYNGTYELAAGGSLLSYEGGQTPQPVMTYEVSVAEALSVQIDVGSTTYDLYRINGRVQSITDSYDYTYKNITLVIEDTTDPSYTMTLYRLTCTSDEAIHLVEGTYVVVEGHLTNYQGEIQLASGGSLISYDVMEYPYDSFPLEILDYLLDNFSDRLPAYSGTAYGYNVEASSSSIFVFACVPTGYELEAIAIYQDDLIRYGYSELGFDSQGDMNYVSPHRELKVCPYFYDNGIMGIYIGIYQEESNEFPYEYVNEWLLNAGIYYDSVPGIDYGFSEYGVSSTAYTLEVGLKADDAESLYSDYVNLLYDCGYYEYGVDDYGDMQYISNYEELIICPWVSGNGYLVIDVKVNTSDYNYTVSEAMASANFFDGTVTDISNDDYEACYVTGFDSSGTLTTDDLKDYVATYLPVGFELYSDWTETADGSTGQPYEYCLYVCNDVYLQYSVYYAEYNGVTCAWIEITVFAHR